MHISNSLFWVAAIIFLVIWLLVDAPRFKLVMLGASGLLFCLFYSPLAAITVVYSAVVCAFACGRIAAEPDETRRRRLTVLAIVAIAAPLVLVKLGPPLMGLVSSADEVRATWLGGLSIPVGLSFYTLQAIGYVVDVQQRHYEPVPVRGDVIVSLMMPPTLPSGPILRAGNILPQLARIPSPTTAQLRLGLLIIAVGLMKKTVADHLGEAAAEFSAHGSNFFVAWSSMLSYAARIYADFSGYSDIAIGMLLMLGISVPANFNLPYLAKSPIEFWLRWHISLSLWLRDYIYFPTAASPNKLRPLVAIFATTLFAGLWHGVAWVFVVYGAYHAVLLVGFYLASRGKASFQTRPLLTKADAAMALFTFYLILIGSSLVRSGTLTETLHWLEVSHGFGAEFSLFYSSFVTLIVALGSLIALHVVDYWVRDKAPHRVKLVYVAIVLCISFTVMFTYDSHPFIYANF
jgi:alginate O-acetyltransferase complex protein AlgI